MCSGFDHDEVRFSDLVDHSLLGDLAVQALPLAPVGRIALRLLVLAPDLVARHAQRLPMPARDQHGVGDAVHEARRREPEGEPRRRRTDHAEQPRRRRAGQARDGPDDGPQGQPGDGRDERDLEQPLATGERRLAVEEPPPRAARREAAEVDAHGREQQAARLREAHSDGDEHGDAQCGGEHPQPERRRRAERRPLRAARDGRREARPQRRDGARDGGRGVHRQHGDDREQRRRRRQLAAHGDVAAPVCLGEAPRRGVFRRVVRGARHGATLPQSPTPSLNDQVSTENVVSVLSWP
jgi:hypothetical protein